MGARLKLLVTRPQPDAARTAAHLAALDIEPVIAPMLEAMPINGPLPDPDTISAIAFTSINAVRFFSARTPGADFLAKPVYAVGEATADAARAAGFGDVSAAEGTLANLTTHIASRHKGGAIFHPGARDLTGDLGLALKPHAIPVLSTTFYAMEQAKTFPPGVREALVEGDIAAALFFSARTADSFSRLAAGPDFIVTRTMLHCLCLSENCAAPLTQSHFLRIALAGDPSHEAMMALALAFTRDQIRA